MTTKYTLNFFQNLAHCPEDESVILSSLYNTIAGLSVKQGRVNQIMLCITIQQLLVTPTVINEEKSYLHAKYEWI